MSTEIICQGRVYREDQWLPWHTISATVYETRNRWPRSGYQVRIIAIESHVRAALNGGQASSATPPEQQGGE